MLTQKQIAHLADIVGKDNALTNKEDLLSYSFDATAGLERSMPELVLHPTSTGQVQEIMKFAYQENIPVYPRGSGTNLSGGTIPLAGGIVLSMVKMDRIVDLDTENLVAVVQPGLIVQTLNDAVKGHGLIYPPDPGTVGTATIGGTVAECAGGLRGLKYGVTKHYVMGLEVVLADGEVMRIGGKTVKNVTGYDLTKLFTGSEGTLGIITEVTVKLIPAPEYRLSLMAVFDDLDKAARTISDIVMNKVIPATLEIMDNTTIRTVENYSKVGLPVDAEAILLIEVDGIEEVAKREFGIVESICKKNGVVNLQVAKSDEEREVLWTARRAALPALAQVSPTTILEDATVPRSHIPDMIKAVRNIAEKYNLRIGTFGHAGDGNLHPTILADDRNHEEMERVEKAVEEIFEVALKLGGTLSGEHGIGIAKQKYLEREFGPSGLQIMKKIKQALDPKGILNPGKMAS